MKMLGIIIVILTSAAAGAAMSESLSRRCALLRAADRFLEKSAILIRSRSSTFEDIISEACADERLAGFEFIRKIKERADNGEINLRRIWKECLDVYRPDHIRDDEMAVLYDFGETLGSTDTEGQLSRISGMREELARITKEAENDSREKGKLYRILGVTAGLFAAVVLI